MKKWLFHIMLISVLGILAASCNQIIDDPTSGDCEMDTEKVQITFTLSMKAAAPDSRTWGTDYDPNNIGNEFENQIDLDNLQVLVFSETTFVGEVNILAYWKVAENIYEFRGELPNAQIDKNIEYKVMVFANCPDVDGNTDLAKLSFVFHGTGADTKYIPMWGVKTTKFTLERFQDLGTIKVLRAMSKVEVKLNKDFTDYTLKSVQLNAGKYNKDGFCLPTHANAAKTEDMGIISVFKPKNTGTNAGNATSALAFTKTGNTHYVYIPEYTTTIDVENPSMTITLVDNANNEKTYPLEFKYYSGDKEGQAFNIVRNHWYQYSITGVSNGLDLTLAVVPWTENKDILDYTQHTANYHVSSNDGTLGWIDETFTKKENNEITLNLNQTATFKVKIGTPINAEWRVTLDDPQNMFEFNTNEGDGFSGTQQEDSKTIYGFNDLDGEVVTIGIKSKSPVTTGVYSAILRMYINLGTKWIQLDLVDGDITNGISVYTIKHVKSGL